jgi:hypothetical protein
MTMGSKNKGGRETRKPKQDKKPKAPAPSVSGLLPAHPRPGASPGNK